MTRLKAGFIGAGPRGRQAHYPNIARLGQDVEMTAVSELDEGRLDQVVERYGFSQVFTNHQEMLANVELDLVYCVMNERWLLQPALDCIRAGKHLFIEKPPGANVGETEQLLRAAVEQNVFVMVGYQRRFTAVVREAMRRVAIQGTPSMAVGRFHKQMLGDQADGFTTTLWNDITHMVDLVRYMAGGEAAEVTAYRDKVGADSRNRYSALIRFDNNATGVILGNRASGGRILQAELHAPGVGCYMDIPGRLEILTDNQREVMGGWEVDGVDQADEAEYEGVLTMHRHFLDAIRTGRTPLTDIRDIIHTARLVAQIEGPL